MSTVAATADDAQVQAWPALEDTVATSIAATLATPEAWERDPDSLRQAIDQGIRRGIEIAVQAAADRWSEDVLGAPRYARTASRVGYRGGLREHTVHFGFGPVSIRVSKPRSGTSRPEWLPALKKAPDALIRFVRTLWLRGLSTRDIAATADEIAGRAYSHTTIAEWLKDVHDEVLRWLNRPIRKDLRYLVLDGIYIPVVRERSKREPILVAMGITHAGEKEILDVMHAPSESADAWGTVLSRLKLRGLDPRELQLVITDGDEGVLSAVDQHLPTVRRQRCTVHKVRNVVGRTPRDLKGTIPGEAASIYKAPSRAEAERRAAAFIAKYEASHPKVAQVVADDLDACLAFYAFDPGRWRGLRSTNALERVNRELRRKLREVGAMKAELNVTRVAVEVARFVNQDMEGRPIDGFGRPRKRGSRKRQSAPTS